MTKTLSTKIVDHGSRAHALLSASGAKRWMNCTPSARLEDAQGPRPTTPYAEEGTIAHELSELYLRHDVLGTVSDDEFNARLEELMSHELFSDEMLDIVPIYVDYCTSQYKAALSENPMATMEIEAKLDLRTYVPQSFGTSDCVIINDSVLEVIDLKYGKGVPVYAEHNEQGMLYALGALLEYDTIYDIERVLITIVQPRINNISSWEIKASDLMQWAENELQPIAKKAFNGEGELKPGAWCKFCVVKNRCRALYEETLSVAKEEFKRPDLITDAEIVELLSKKALITEYLDSVAAYAQQKAVEEGKVWPGYKVVRSVTRRKWADEDTAVAEIFKQFPAATEDQIFKQSLVSITEIEKIFGKKIVAEKLKNVIIKPEGTPVLVPQDDKRPALGLEDAVNDFQ